MAIDTRSNSVAGPLSEHNGEAQRAAPVAPLRAGAPAPLEHALGRLRSRLLWIGGLSGLGWALILATLLCLTLVWLDLVWELGPGLRRATRLLAVASGSLWLLAALLRASRAGRRDRLARRLDRAGAAHGEIVAGYDLSRTSRQAWAPSPAPVTAGLATLAVQRAAALAETVPHARAVPARPLARSLAAMALTGISVAAIVLAAPRLASTEWLRFSDPDGDHPPYSRVLFQVVPGDTAVVYASGLDVLVTTEGPPVERVDLVLRDPQSGAEESLPMFPETGGQWRGVLTRVTEPGQYYVRAARSRSPRFNLDVITVPRLESVRFRVTPPAYTRQPAYTGVLPEGGLSGLPGTQVQVWATSNRPLSAGELRLGLPNGSRPVPLSPAAAGESEVTGRFELTESGKFELHVTDVDGRRSREAFAGSITMLHDDKPFVRILQPAANSLATPQATLPVLLSGEDDYGIARVELFRSLNESRALPRALPVASPPVPRYDGSEALPLSSYGLEPGDVIKLFARIEDNDPAGAKGAESPIVEVRIISQQEYERLLRVKEGLNVLLSKYRQAQRRMASLADEEQGLRKKLQPDSKQPISPETRDALKKLARNLRKEAREVEKSTQHLLPYDIDKQLSEQLSALAEALQHEAQAADELAENGDLSDEQLADWLEASLKRLSQEREQFDREASEPLDYLEQIYPLIEDQARFVALYRRQRELAGRLASLKGRDGEDNPQLKGRMRDLEHEQARLHDALGDLLDDIEAHANRLPDDERLEELRAGALKFADAVRQSGAAEAMGDAQTALAEFAGTRAHESAERAADLLEGFLSECESMGQGLRGCLKFQPGLSRGLGNTIAQLLGEGGLPQSGAGQGGDGYSMNRSSLDNMGLYGQMPGMDSSDARGQGRDGQLGDGGRNSARHQRNDPTQVEAPGEIRASGGTGAAVPLHYRNRVGAYFQRIAEESEK